MEKKEEKTFTLNLRLAEVGMDNRHKRLIRDNRIILKKLKRINNGPFGIKKWFRSKDSD